MKASEHEFFLPLEVIENIFVFAADSGGHRVALGLSLVSHALHKCAMNRLYHTLRVDSEAKLEDIFRVAILPQSWIAPAVRVLSVSGRHSADYDNLLVQVLSALTGLISIRLPWSAAIDRACLLPRLRRVSQAGPAPLPLHISHNITHLHIASFQAFSQVLQMKEEFGRLTHFLLTFIDMLNLSQFLGDFRYGLPQSLKFLAVYLGFIQSDLTGDAHRLSLLQDLIDTDNRIVYWSWRAVPSSWKSPRLLLFNKNHLISHCLGALKDGKVEFWELVERHVQERLGNTP